MTLGRRYGVSTSGLKATFGRQRILREIELKTMVAHGKDIEVLGNTYRSDVVSKYSHPWSTILLFVAHQYGIGEAPIVTLKMMP